MAKLSSDSQVKVLAFLAAMFGVVAASEVPPPEIRLGAGAIAAGCGSVLALMRQVGTQRPPGGDGRG